MLSVETSAAQIVHFWGWYVAFVSLMPEERSGMAEFASLDLIGITFIEGWKSFPVLIGMVGLYWFTA